MQPNSPIDPPASANGEPQATGLPPVTPPSGRHILQMFVVPGIIVVVIVLLWLGAQWLVKGAGNPKELLAGLEDNNADVRWRAANDLTQRLKRDDQLASDPGLALTLTDLLRRRLAEYDDAQASYRLSLQKKDDALIHDSFKHMREKRKDVQFLIPCAGSLMLPTGAPMLCEVLRREKSPDEKGLILLRRDAVWSIANLGENVRRLRQLSPERRTAIGEALESEVAQSTADERKRWAQQSLDFVRAIQEGRQRESLGIVQALADAARDDGDDSDPFLREQIAHAFNSWDGPPAEEKVIEQTLVRLSHDAGRGKTIEIGEDD